MIWELYTSEYRIHYLLFILVKIITFRIHLRLCFTTTTIWSHNTKMSGVIWFQFQYTYIIYYCCIYHAWWASGYICGKWYVRTFFFTIRRNTKIGNILRRKCLKTVITINMIMFSTLMVCLSFLYYFHLSLNIMYTFPSSFFFSCLFWFIWNKSRRIISKGIFDIIQHCTLQLLFCMCLVFYKAERW